MAHNLAAVGGAAGTSAVSNAAKTTLATEASLQDEMKELGWEAVRFVAGITATVIATRIVWHFLNPFRKDEEKAEANRQYLIDRLGDNYEDIETDQYEDQIAAGLMCPQDIDVNFSDVAGLTGLKQSLKELVILPFNRPELFPPGSLVGPPKGVLLWGPPGTGKTMLAKAIAKETDARFINVPLSTLQSQWFGESQSLVRATFSLARKLAPCIIFIDEIDSFMRQRRRDDHQAVSDMRAEFMSMWDGMLSDPEMHVMVLGTTNKMGEIDPAMLRRMPRRFEVPLPNENHRIKILKTVLRNEKLIKGFDFKMIAGHTNGYSGSDLKELCKASAMAPLRSYIQEGEQGALRELCVEDVLRCIDEVKPASDMQEDDDAQIQSRQSLQALLEIGQMMSQMNVPPSSAPDASPEAATPIIEDEVDVD